MTLTAPVTLNLTTPRTVSKAMALLGIRWMPTPVPGSALKDEHGLYTWVDGRGAFCQCGCGNVTLSDNLLDRAILYSGVGESTSGVIGRVIRETSFIGEGSDHGHGMAMYHRRGVPVIGNVELIPTDLNWIDARIKPDGAEIARTWLTGIRTQPATLFKAAERLAIRICIHVGDVGAPVNSTHAGGWESNHGADWAAFAVAAEMRAKPPSHLGETMQASPVTTV
ncbi:hypothetical protein ABZY10_29370 [Streptomyces sp. NPDC006539]|uniref:hypothetical protein n=1 Tax=Streptomyces sp. NPDC006539 TaxID=3155352 RepID=UPI0033A790C2